MALPAQIQQPFISLPFQGVLEYVYLFLFIITKALESNRAGSYFYIYKCKLYLKKYSRDKSCEKVSPWRVKYNTVI